METIDNLNDTTIDKLQDLIRINIDSSKGFETAAKNIENRQISNYFSDCSARRAGFATELQGHVAWSGDEPEDSGSLRGTLHRWWLDIRGTVQDGDEHGVLAEAERGEDAIKERYEDVLKETAGSPLNALLQQHYVSVKADHDAIRDMRDARAE